MPTAPPDTPTLDDATRYAARAILAGLLDRAAIDDTHRLVQDLGADAAGLPGLLLDLAEEFGAEIEPRLAEGCEEPTVADVLDALAVALANPVGG